ncbi:MAG: hypothetical protein IPM98_10485 [Lewinellaceae bacterium]|nr:hypothetical protein [Lewinellaceae bacterium]
MQKTIWTITTLLLLGLLALPFCVKPPDYPKEPVIEFVSLSKNVLLQTPFGQDSVVITFSFTDGDGDLGFQDGEESIFIKDGRDTFQKPSYRIPYIDQQGAGNGISGEISIVVPTTCCTYTDPLTGIKIACENVPIAQDSVFYRVSIKDRSENISNEISTPWIRLICK